MDNKGTLLASLGLPLLIMALAVGYYFFIFLPSVQSQESLAENQTSCDQMATAFVQSKERVLWPGATIASKNHYNRVLRTCLIELNYNNPITGPAIYTESYSLFDIVENNELTECVLPLHETTFICSDERDSDSLQANGTKISRAQFDSIEREYMTE